MAGLLVKHERLAEMSVDRNPFRTRTLFPGDSEDCEEKPVGRLPRLTKASLDTPGRASQERGMISLGGP